MTYEAWLLDGVPAGKDELRFDCFECGKEKKFYWNTKLHVGHCFVCSYAANMLRLSRKMGFSIYAKPSSFKHLKAALKPTLLKKQVRDTAELVIPGKSAFDSIPALEYLLERKVTANEIKKYQIRYDESMPPRIVLPICTRQGVVAGWTARALSSYAVPKYKFPSGFSAGDHLFGIQFAKSGTCITIVEGPFDQIRFGSGSVATFGKHLTDRQLTLIIKLRPTVVAIMWDADAIRESKALAGRLQTIVPVKLVSLPGKDPGSLTRWLLRKLVRNTPLYRSNKWLLEELNGLILL